MTSSIPLTFLVNLEMYIKTITLDAKMTQAECATMDIERVGSDYIYCEHVDGIYKRAGLDDQYIMPLSGIVDILYRHVYQHETFKNKPITLVSVYRNHTRYDIYRALAFAADHRIGSLTIHLIVFDDIMHKQCDNMLRQLDDVRFRTYADERYHNMSMIVDFFGLQQYPYVPKLFGKRLCDARFNIIDVKLPNV